LDLKLGQSPQLFFPWKMKQLSRLVQAIAATKRKGMKRLKLRIEEVIIQI
jgi:hypothetical protein